MLNETIKEILAKLAQCITQNRGYREKITRNQFADASDAFLAMCAPLFERLGAELAENGTELGEAADCLLNAVEDGWYPKGRKRKLDEENDKIVLAIFFIPALKRTELSIKEAFSEAIREKWMEKHPRSPFYIGTYEDLAAGFQKRFFSFFGR